jgi:hypothetical protein
MRHVTVVLAIAACLFVRYAPALADGIKMQHGHVVEARTVLTLTADQGKSIRHKRIGEVTLTAAQKTLLRQETGFAPQRLRVWSLAETEDSCTCEALNVGVATFGNRVEVVHSLLGKDIYDRGKHGRQQAAKRP